MSILKLAIYLLVSTLAILNAQSVLIRAQKDLQGSQVLAPLREVLYGLSLYTLTYWRNLTSALPQAISYKNPVSGNLVNVQNILSPTADELMMLGFLASATTTSSTYPGLPRGGAGHYQTAIAITPAGCTDNVCNTDLDVFWTQPVAQSKGKFDILLTSTAINDEFISMGYTYPDDPTLFKSSTDAWTHPVASKLTAQSGLAMIHTDRAREMLAARYPASQSIGWRTPGTQVSDLSTPWQTNAISDIRVATATGVPYFWTGSFWSPLNTSTKNTTYLGPASGNTGDNSLYIGSFSGNKFYVAN